MDYGYDAIRSSLRDRGAVPQIRVFAPATRRLYSPIQARRHEEEPIMSRGLPAGAADDPAGLPAVAADPAGTDGALRG